MPLIGGERILSVVVGVLNFSVEKPLDFHDTTFSVSPSFLKYNKAAEELNLVVLHY